MKLSGIKEKIRDLVQEYSFEWLSEDMLTSLINDAIKHISCKTMVLKKLATITVSKTNLIPLPDDFLNSIHIKVGTHIYPKINFEDIEVFEGENYHYYIDGVLYLSKEVTGSVELFYNYIPIELTDNNDDIPTVFNGFEKTIIYFCGSEIMGMNNDLQTQGFFYRIYETNEKIFISTRSNISVGRPLIKKVNTRTFWDKSV